MHHSTTPVLHSYVYFSNISGHNFIALNTAMAAGAKHEMPKEMFWGDRVGSVTDPSGIKWTVATHTRDVTPAELQKAMADLAQGGAAPAKAE